MNLVIIHLMDPLRPSQGGAVRHILYLLRYFLERNYKVVFIGIQDDKGYPVDRVMYEHYKKRKLSIVYLSRGYDFLKFVINLSKIFFKLRVNSETLIHHHQLYFVLPFILCRKCKLILTLHAKPLHTLEIEHKFIYRFFKPFYKLIEFMVFKRCEIVIFTSKDLREQYSKFDKAIVLPGGMIDTELFKPVNNMRIIRELRFKHGFQDNEYILLYIGRLEKVKRVDLLIETIKILIEKGLYNIKLLIVGEGNELFNLIEKTRQLGLEKNVIFAGPVPPNEVVTFYNIADILCLPSIVEVSPNVIKEAMATGLPFITTVSTTEIRMFSSKNCGLILPHNINPHELAELIVSFIKVTATKRHEIMKECRNFVKMYDYRLLMSILERIYLSVTSQRVSQLNNSQEVVVNEK